jgi:ABC-type multidrug transport system fused ATPase/permease subunit
VVQYVSNDTIPQEAPHEIEERKPPALWPEHGAVEFNDVKMAYRPGLPNILRGISVKVMGGEKIGVVGRLAGLSDLHTCANVVSLQDWCWQIFVDARIVSNC